MDRLRNSFPSTDSRSDPAGAYADEPSGIPCGQFRLSSCASPRRVSRCSVHVSLKESLSHDWSSEG
jgi:hypothetical protein